MKAARRFARRFLPTFVAFAGVIAMIALLTTAEPLPKGHHYSWARIVIAVVVVTPIVTTLAFATSKRWKRWSQHTFPWLPIVLGAASYEFWYWYPSNVQKNLLSIDFFSVSAEVLPLLMLAAVIDLHGNQRLNAYKIALPILAVVVGEIAALSVCAGTDPPNRTNFALVCTAFVVAVTTLLLLLLSDIGSRTK